MGAYNLVAPHSGTLPIQHSRRRSSTALLTLALGIGTGLSANPTGVFRGAMSSGERRGPHTRGARAAAADRPLLLGRDGLL